MTSDKDIDEKNAEREVKYAEHWCKECGEPYWTGIEGFCSEKCKDLYGYDEDMNKHRLQIEDLIHDFHKEEL